MTPSHAEQARTILAANTEGTLATVDIDGRPVVSPVPMVADAAGVPVMVVSNLSTHSSRGRRDARCGMDIGGRLLIQGDLRPVPGIQQIEMTDAICEARPELRTAIESLDWSWLRLEPTRIRLTDDAGDERWLRPADVAGAEPDPLVLLGADFIDVVREKLDDQLLLIAKTLGGRWLATSGEVAAIDRYGVVLDVAEPAGVRPSRVPFPQRLDHPDDVHAALGGLVLAARAAARRDDVADNPTEWPDERTTTNSDIEEPTQPEVDTDDHACDAQTFDAALSSDDPAIDTPHAATAPTSGGSALIDGLRQAAAQTKLNGPIPDADSILLTNDDLYRSGGVRPWREADERPPVLPEDADPFDTSATADDASTDLADLADPG